MAFQVSVVVHYDFDGLTEERSTGFTIEQETPISRADIQAEVDAVVLDLVNPDFYHNLEGFVRPSSYSWEVESVFEF